MLLGARPPQPADVEVSAPPGVVPPADEPSSGVVALSVTSAAPTVSPPTPSLGPDTDGPATPAVGTITPRRLDDSGGGGRVEHSSRSKSSLVKFTVDPTDEHAGAGRPVSVALALSPGSPTRPESRWAPTEPQTPGLAAVVSVAADGGTAASAADRGSLGAAMPRTPADLRQVYNWAAGAGPRRSARYSSASSLLAPPTVQAVLQEITMDRCTSVSFTAATVLVKKGLEVIEAALDYDRYGFRFTPDRNLSYDPEPAPHVTERRERKWDAMLAAWDEWIAARPAKIRSRCRKGIPPSRRAAAWYAISGGRALAAAHAPGTFEKLVERAGSMVDAAVLQLIDLDVPRSFPEHRLLEAGGRGLPVLTDVLRAFAAFNPDIGYCQGMNFVAGTLLIAGMSAHDAFWTLVSLTSYHMAGYFNGHLSQLRMDISMFGILIRDHVPAVARVLEQHCIEPLHFATRWFMAAFAHSLPWDAAMRLWDRFLFEGSQTLFQAAIAIIKLKQRTWSVRDSALGSVEDRLPGEEKEEEGEKKKTKEKETEAEEEEEEEERSHRCASALRYRADDLVRAAAFEDVINALQPANGLLSVSCRQLLASMKRHVVSPATLVKAHQEALALFPPPREKPSAPADTGAQRAHTSAAGGADGTAADACAASADAATAAQTADGRGS